MANFTETKKLEFLDEIQLKLTDPDLKSNNVTNHVLFQEVNEGYSRKSDKEQRRRKSLVYYLPAYVWIRIRNFTNLSHENLEGEINLTINVVINMNEMPKVLQEKIRQKIVLRFNRDDAINLGGSKSLEVTHSVLNQQKSIQEYTIRKILKAGMVPDVFFTPFEMIYLILSLRIQELQIIKREINDMFKGEVDQEKKVGDLKGKKQIDNPKENQNLEKKQEEYLKNYESIRIFFNLMDIDQEKQKFSKILYTDEGTYGNYDLAEKKLRVEYTNDEISSRIIGKKKPPKVEQEKFYPPEIKQFSYAHFQIPVYRFPCVGIFTIFVPLWLLAIINLAIFFQDTGLADRIGNLAGLMIAFVALIPVIRQQLPPTPQITAVQIIVYLQSAGTICCFIESIIVRDDGQYVFEWFTNGWFWAALIVSIAGFLVILVLSIIFFIKKMFFYNKIKDQEYKSDFSAESYKKWANPACDKHFRQKIDSGEIKFLQLNKKEKRANK